MEDDGLILNLEPTRVSEKSKSKKLPEKTKTKVGLKRTKKEKKSLRNADQATGGKPHGNSKEDASDVPRKTKKLKKLDRQKRFPVINTKSTTKKPKQFEVKHGSSSIMKPVRTDLRTANTSKTTVEVFAEGNFGSISGLNERLIHRLENENGFGFSRMTTIQQMTIPNLLAGKDCFVKSQTGSGKTLAYAVPCVQKLSELEPRIQRQDGPYAIILTPTRELTIQTYEVFEKLLKAFIWIVPGYIAGGEKRKSEKARLRKGINVLVCTPGRLTDHLKHTSNLSLNKVRWMIYDEADRLLDGGFEQDIKMFVDQLRQSGNSQCQSVLLSATLNKNVSQLADLTLLNPVYITPSVEPEAENKSSSMDDFVLPKSLQQSYLITPAKQRLLTLIGLILSKFKAASTNPRQCKKMLVFLATQDSVDFHYYLLDHIINEEPSEDEDRHQRKKQKTKFGHQTVNEDGVRTNVEIYRLHGSMTQQERTAVYKEFSKARTALLLATDVAARGLHIPQLDCIVQYNTPGQATDYVHRVGRTARMGRTGNAILFLMPTELPYLDILAEYGIKMNELRQNDFLEILVSEAEVGRLPDALHTFQQRCEEFIYSRNDVFEMARKAYLSFIRSYSAYPGQLKSIFNVHHLHLGHMAKCFALKETPKDLGAYRPGANFVQRHDRGGSHVKFRPAMQERRKRKFDSKQEDGQRSSWKKEKRTESDWRSTRPPKRRKPIDMSEFGSGLDSIGFV